MTDTIAYAGTAAASAVAAPDDTNERERRAALRLERLFERVDKLAAKADRQRAQLEDTERALAEAIAEVEGA